VPVVSSCEEVTLKIELVLGEYAFVGANQHGLYSHINSDYSGAEKAKHSWSIGVDEKSVGNLSSRPRFLYSKKYLDPYPIQNY